MVQPSTLLASGALVGSQGLDATQDNINELFGRNPGSAASTSTASGASSSASATPSPTAPAWRLFPDA
eukprot:8357264-Alexandrium_andersonii.AAC.1